MRASFIRCLILLFLFSLAGLSATLHDGDEAGPSAVPVPNQPEEKEHGHSIKEPLVDPTLFDSLVKIGGTTPTEEAAPEEGFRYSVPNEYSNYLQEPRIDANDKGALVSVGTFRAYDVASSGSVNALILFDRSRKMKLFNLICLQLISISRDRYEFLSYLLTGELQKDLISAAKKKNGGVSTLDFIKSLQEKMKVDHQAWKKGQREYPLWEHWKTLGVRLPEMKDWVEAKNVSAPFATLEDQLFDSLKYFERFSKLGTLKHTIFGSDDRFSRFQNMIKEGKVRVMQGDLLSSKGLPELSKLLRKENIQVSALDVSNVPGYVASAPPSPKKQFLGFIEKMDTLPLTKNAVILLTERFDSDPETSDWAYYAISPSQFKQIPTVCWDSLKLSDTDFALRNFSHKLLESGWRIK